jgi:hypothetical protein
MKRRLYAAVFAAACFFSLFSCEQPSGENVSVKDDENTAASQTGILLSVIVPAGITLTGESRVLIEKLDLIGAAFETLTIPVTGTVEGYKVTLPAGLYSVDVLLVAAGGKIYKALEEIEVKATDYVEGGEEDVSSPRTLTFEPGGGSGDGTSDGDGTSGDGFLTKDEYETLTTELMFNNTAQNSAGVKLTKSGGSGAARTREMTALNGSSSVYFRVNRKTVQTLSLAGAVRLAQGAADGTTPGITDASRGIYVDVLIVDTSSVSESGGSIKFTITVSETEKNSIKYDVTVIIPSVVSGQALLIGGPYDGNWGAEMGMEMFGHKYTYAVGDAFDRRTVSVECVYSDGTKRTETEYEVRGFDSSKQGLCLVKFYKGGKALTTEASGTDHVDAATGSLIINVIKLKEPHLVFDYGRRIRDGDPVPGRYTVTEGRKLVIAPILWRIPENATFNWTVSGTGASYTENKDFLTFKPDTAAGNYNVTVTASFDGKTASASTVVECVNSSSQPSAITSTASVAYAPGNSLWYGGCLGGFGGYWINPLSINNGGGNDLSVGSNAFAAWEEPGIVSVMKDENKNGQPDDTWYELRGNISEEFIYRRYAVTYYKGGAWQDSRGRYGTFAVGYPDDAPDEMTLPGTLIEYYGGVFPKAGLMSGYADTIYPVCDISNAVYIDGTPVDPPLDHIDFVRQHTGSFARTKAFGEISTETGPATSMWGSAASITGVSGGGGYQYHFINNSGYDVIVYLKDHPNTVSVPAGGNITVTLSVSSTLYKTSGGNVTTTLSGNTLTFANGAGG